MSLLVRSRNLPLLIALVLATTIGACLLTNVLAPLPSLTGVGVGIPAAIATPLITAALILGTTVSGHPERELTSTRPIRILDAAIPGGLTAVCCVIFFGAAAMINNPILMASARNLIGLVGLGLILRRWVEPAIATLLTTAYALTTFSLGNRLEPEPWAWLLEQPQTVGAAVIAVGLLPIGLWNGSSHMAKQREL